MFMRSGRVKQDELPTFGSDSAEVYLSSCLYFGNFDASRVWFALIVLGLCLPLLCLRAAFLS